MTISTTHIEVSEKYNFLIKFISLSEVNIACES